MIENFDDPVAHACLLFSGLRVLLQQMESVYLLRAERQKDRLSREDHKQHLRLRRELQKKELTRNKGGVEIYRRFCLNLIRSPQIRSST
jgi:hypothetical protein